MSAVHTRRAISDRTLNRLIVSLAIVLLVGIPAIAAIYWFDRNVDSGPGLSDRNVAKMEQAVRDNPNLVSARITLAGFYVESKRWNDAIVQYSEVLKIDKVNTLALLGRGNANEQLGNLDTAVADYQALIDSSKGQEMANVNPQLESAYYRLGSIQLTQGKTKDAINTLIFALKIDKGDADAMYLLGTAYLKDNQADQAVLVLHDAVAFQPTGWCEPYTAMIQGFTALKQADGVTWATAMAAFCGGKPDEAKAALAPLVDGQFAFDSLLGLGFIAEAQGDIAAAKDYYTRAVAKNPQDFNANQGVLRTSAALGGTAAPSSSPGASQAAAPAASASGSN